MIKNFLVLCICLGLGGCVSYQYIGIYNYAVKAKTTTTITKEGNLSELRERVSGFFEAHGYKSIIYQDRKNGLFVFTKEGDFNEPCQIILKYTLEAGADKVRVDMVKASDDLITDNQVTVDIHEIADQIKAVSP